MAEYLCGGRVAGDKDRSRSFEVREHFLEARRFRSSTFWKNDVSSARSFRETSFQRNIILKTLEAGRELSTTGSKHEGIEARRENPKLDENPKFGIMEVFDEAGGSGNIYRQDQSVQTFQYLHDEAEVLSKLRSVQSSPVKSSLGFWPSPLRSTSCFSPRTLFPLSLKIVSQQEAELSGVECLVRIWNFILSGFKETLYSLDQEDSDEWGHVLWLSITRRCNVAVIRRTVGCPAVTRRTVGRGRLKVPSSGLCGRGVKLVTLTGSSLARHVALPDHGVGLDGQSCSCLIVGWPIGLSSPTLGVGRPSVMFLFDCWPVGRPMLRTVRGCYKLGRYLAIEHAHGSVAT
ncbi:hypothetical protein DY000_02017417 [Brassica cretica]|uniref:Uncharacterized protein n=1 Tax=Brassica cretica TaxID=69181 RepID=A0ABQ7CWR6_BRACR|nr:hypothetical protein DY000_02017417 [Brassica cretica]